MATETSARQPGHQAILRGLLLVLLTVLWRRHQGTFRTLSRTEAWQRLAAILPHLYDTAGVDQTREKLAALVGWSPDHFARLFHDAMGETVRTFLRRLRARRAATLLATTADSVAVIAAAAGYANARSLRRAFLACFGMTPETYRKRG